MPAELTKRFHLIAHLTSVILHPLIVASVTFIILLGQYDDLNRSQKILLFGLIFLAIVVVPLLSVLRLKKRGQTTSLDVPERAKRISPFVVSVVGYLLVWLALKLVGAPDQIVALILIYTVNTAIATVITHFWKISVHGMALGGPIAALGRLVSSQYYWLILAAPLMFYSRVKLKAHTLAQVSMGFLLGFILTLIQLGIIL